MGCCGAVVLVLVWVWVWSAGLSWAWMLGCPGRGWWCDLCWAVDAGWCLGLGCGWCLGLCVVCSEGLFWPGLAGLAEDGEVDARMGQVWESRDEGEMLLGLITGLFWVSSCLAFSARCLDAGPVADAL